MDISRKIWRQNSRQRTLLRITRSLLGPKQIMDRASNNEIKRNPGPEWKNPHKVIKFSNIWIIGNKYCAPHICGGHYTVKVSGTCIDIEDLKIWISGSVQFILRRRKLFIFVIPVPAVTSKQPTVTQHFNTKQLAEKISGPDKISEHPEVQALSHN